ncbi:MAG: CBS domain-containing protein [Methanoregula sp.]
MKTAQDFMVEIPVLKETDGMTKARQILRDDRFREVYVTDARKNLTGYIDITDALRVTATKSNVTLEGFVKDATTGSREDSVETVARMMRDHHTDSAVIIDRERHILGGVLLSDIFPVIISRNEMPGKVATHMTGNVVVASPTDNIQKVYTLIMESGFTAFPVVKKKHLVGIISRRDLISSRAVRSTLTGHAQKTVDDLMKQPVVTITPDEPVSKAAKLLVQYDVSRLPVLDGETLVGIIDRHDVLSGLS